MAKRELSGEAMSEEALVADVEEAYATLWMLLDELHDPDVHATGNEALDVLERAYAAEHEARVKAQQALVDLHESLFIGSERGLSKEALRSMAAFAKAAALAPEASDG